MVIGVNSSLRWNDVCFKNYSGKNHWIWVANSGEIGAPITFIVNARVRWNNHSWWNNRTPADRIFATNDTWVTTGVENDAKSHRNVCQTPLCGECLYGEIFACLPSSKRSRLACIIALGKPRERSVPLRGTKQEMKKTLLLIAAAALILNASGCGSCRNLFGSRSSACATPMMGSVQRCAPVCCQPTCCMPSCDPCCSDSSAVSYGYDGGTPMMMGAPMGTSDCNCGQ